MKHLKVFQLENLFVVSILLIGICGAFTVFHGSGPAEPAPAAVPAEVGGVPDASYQSPQLKVSGLMEAGVPLHFRVEGWKPGMQLFVDLGDGNLHELRRAEFTYTYSRAGAREVRLLQGREGNTRVIQTVWLRIGMDVAMVQR